jgi:hypothetical protein
MFKANIGKVKELIVNAVVKIADKGPIWQQKIIENEKAIKQNIM